MKAMILGAGIGSRLDPLTRSLPKPLVPVVGTPVIGHLINLLKQHGITEIVINVQYLGHKIESAIGDGSRYGVSVRFEHEEKLSGDAGGLKRVESFFREGDDDTFLVIGGDDLTDFDIAHLVREHRDKKAVATLGVTPVEDPSEYGIVVQDDAGFITRFQEKPKKGEAFSNLANTGIYVFTTKVFDYIPAGEFYGFGNNVFPALMAANEPMFAVSSNAYWKDVGNHAIYRQAQRDCIDGKVAVTMRGTLTRGEHGAVLIGEGSQIAPDALLADYAILGANCVVESGATIKNSVLWDGAIVKAGTYLENCVVGEGVSVQSSHGIFNGLIVEAKRPQ